MSVDEPPEPEETVGEHVLRSVRCAWPKSTVVDDDYEFALELALQSYNMTGKHETGG